MVRLLECQKKERKNVTSDELALYSIALICLLLETFEVDLTTDELNEIKQFAKDWTE